MLPICSPQNFSYIIHYFFLKGQKVCLTIVTYKYFASGLKSYPPFNKVFNIFVTSNLFSNVKLEKYGNKVRWLLIT